MQLFSLHKKYVGLALVAVSVASTVTATEKFFEPIILNNTTPYGVLIGGGAGAPIVSTVAGTAGYVLTANGASAPTWLPAGGGDINHTSTYYTTGALNIGFGSTVTPGTGSFSVSTTGTTVVGNNATLGRLLGSNPVCAQVGTIGGLSNPRSVSWSPDGKYLAEVNYGDNSMNVYAVSGGTPVLVGQVTGLTYPQSVSWSPDGKYLAEVNAAVSPSGSMNVYAFSGGNPVLVGQVTGLASPYSVSWSPDGKYLAEVNYLSGSAGSMNVYAFSGGTPVPVGQATGLAYPYSVSWSPDGKYLAEVNSVASGSMNVYAFSGGNPVLVGQVTGLAYPYSVSWSPDGKYLAEVNFLSGSAGSMNVYAVSGGNPVPVGQVTGLTKPSSVSWSPDGQYLAEVNYDTPNGSMNVYAVSGGTPNLVGTIGSLSNPISVSWSPDGQYLAEVNAGNSNMKVYAVNSALFAPLLTISGNTLGKGDLTITGSAQMGQTTINGTLMVDSSTAKIGANGDPTSVTGGAGLPGGVGVLTLGGNGGNGGLNGSGAGGAGGPGGTGEIFLGGFGGYGGDGSTTTGLSGNYGNGMMSLGAEYVTATKISTSPSDLSPLTYQLELSATWTTRPIIMLTAYASNSPSAGESYAYYANIGIALKTGVPLLYDNSSTYTLYKNDGVTPSVLTQSTHITGASLNNNSLSFTLPKPYGQNGPYATAIQVTGPVIRA